MLFRSLVYTFQLLGLNVVFIGWLFWLSEQSHLGTACHLPNDLLARSFRPAHLETNLPPILEKRAASLPKRPLLYSLCPSDQTPFLLFLFESFSKQQNSESSIHLAPQWLDHLQTTRFHLIWHRFQGFSVSLCTWTVKAFLRMQDVKISTNASRYKRNIAFQPTYFLLCSVICWKLCEFPPAQRLGWDLVDGRSFHVHAFWTCVLVARIIKKQKR